MPKIRSITTADNLIQISDHLGVRAFNASSIPVAQNTIAKVENYLNTVAIPALLDGSYQMQVHVFSLNPLKVSVITANPDVVIVPNWWQKN